MRVRRVLVIVAAMLLLVGCGGSTQPGPAVDKTEAEPAADPEPDPEPGPEPEPEPETDPHPALEDLVISTSGLGPLTVGLPPEGNPGEAMIEWDPEYCVSEMWEGEGDPGGWSASGYSSDTNYMGEPTEPAFYLEADDDTVLRIDVMGAGPRTAEGVGIGTTLAELQATYPDLRGPHDNTISQVWWLQDEHGTLVFETQGDADGLRPAGTQESVILVRVLAPGFDPAWGAANSGNVAGACF